MKKRKIKFTDKKHSRNGILSTILGAVSAGLLFCLLAAAYLTGLAGLLVGVGLESGILLRQLGEGDAHLLLARLGFGLNGHADNRLREIHGLQDNRVLLIAQGVAGGGVLEAHGGGDIARVNGLDILSVIGVHLQNAAHTLVADRKSVV